MNTQIEELFEDKADEAGFCLDKKWGDYSNQYLDSNARIAFDFFRSGFLTAQNIEKEKLEGCVVVPVEPTTEWMANYVDSKIKEHCLVYVDSPWPIEEVEKPLLVKGWEKSISKAHAIVLKVAEAARGGNE